MPYFCCLLLIVSGEFANDRRSGQGAMQYADGSVYNGQWMDNQVSNSLHYNTNKRL